MGFGTIGIFLWVTFIIPPLGIVGMLAGAVIMLLSPFMKGMLQCQDCKKSWKYKPDVTEQI
jgi:hypothetical protein